MAVRWHIFFSGRVQGVGFRYTCQETARRHDVCGWVKNLSDGRVEMIVEGSVGSIRSYLDDVSNSTHGHVEDRAITKTDATGEFQTMKIVR